jgi:eukaryotic-like serine/threonine-protein kinase
MTPDPDRHARLKQLFDEVCDSPDPRARLQALRAQGVDEATLTELDTLLGHVGRPTQFAQPVAAAAAQWLDDSLQPGDRLGAWTLVRTLGHGGMGRVFLAERSDGHYEQQAAIKLLLGWSGPEALALLKRERQILAGLNHPHIAPLLDGGTTAAGQPYLVMAYVEGLAVDAHCAQARANLTQRLALFDSVCAAVAYAHRQLVIHCDLKPSNVLVTAEGRAMLLDFGIARLQGQPEVAAAALTPGYASPEQRAGLPPGMASDIYSLGRLLDALLQPIADSHRRGVELAAVVARATAAQPAQRYASVADLQLDLQRLLAHRPLAGWRHRRGYVLGKLLRRRWPWALAGTAALVMGLGFLLRLSTERDRALQAEQQATRAATAADASATRARQAETAALAAEQQARADQARALAAEARALQQRDRAVAAEQRSARDRDRAVQEERRASLEAATTRETSRFLMSLFTGADPKLTGQPDLPASILLDQGRQRLAQEMDQDRAVRARLQMVLGDVYERMGRNGDAIAAFTDAAAAFAAPEVQQPLAEADALRRLALAQSNAGQFEAAEAPARRALALRERIDGRDLGSIADAANRLGIVLMNQRRFDEAAGHLERALQLRIRTAGADDPNTASTLHNLARMNHLRGHLRTAEAQFRRSLESKRRTLKPSDGRLLGSLEALGLVLSDLQHHAEAERLLREAVDGWLAVYGPDNDNVAIGRQRLGRVLLAAGRLPQARNELEDALRIKARAGSAASVAATVVRADRARLLEAEGALPEAEAEWRAVLARLLPVAPELTVAGAQHGLARTLWQLGRSDEAAPLLAQAQQTRASRLPADNPERLRGQLLAGELAVVRRDLAAADGLVSEVDAALGRPQAEPDQTALRLDLMALRGRAAAAAGQSRPAADWLSQAWRGERAWRGSVLPQMLPLGLDLLAALRASGQPQAVQALLADLQRCAAGQAADSPWRRQLTQGIFALPEEMSRLR